MLGSARESPLHLIDKYILRLTAGPMIGALIVTLITLLLERVLRLLDLLSDSSNRFAFVAELAANLVPHYLGLTLPAAFFIAIFIVVARMGDSSEVDALLASGFSLSRLATPFVGLGLILSIVSLALFGYIQPYARYGYRAVLHAAENAGWNGRVQAQTFITPGRGLTITADIADVAGRRLERIFVRQTPQETGGEERITTARLAELRPSTDPDKVVLAMEDGQQIRTDARGQTDILRFRSLRMEVPLIGAAKLLRARGSDQRELTLNELAFQAAVPDGLIPRQTLLAELFGRLARALSLPLLPLLAVPLGLAAKRGGRAPGIIVAGVMLLSFHHFLQFGQSLAEAGRALAVLALGLPFFIFAGLCGWIFVSSLKRPGDTPIGRMIETISGSIRQLREGLFGRKGVGE